MNILNICIVQICYKYIVNSVSSSMVCMYTPQFMYAAMDIAVYMNWGAYIHTISELTNQLYI